MNDNLPAFVVLPDHRGLASNGTKNWDAAFLPAQHQGTVIYPGNETPIVDLFPDAKRGDFINSSSERDGGALLAKLNATHAATRPGDERLEARIRSYEPRREDATRRTRSARYIPRDDTNLRNVWNRNGW